MELTALKTTYYTLGIIFMALILIVLLTLLIILFYIKHKVSLLQKNIEEKISDLKRHPQEAALDLGASLIEKLVKKGKSGKK